MKKIYLGVMSGTSLDALDTVAVSFANNQFSTLANASLAMPQDLQQLLTKLIEEASLTYADLALAEDSLSRLYAQVINLCVSQLEANSYSQAAIQAVGCHGQTLEHQPNQQPAFTLQLLNPSLVAELTGLAVVADFRRRDLAAGGQAAPLVPAFHAEVFASEEVNRIIVNLGGIANLSYLPARAFDSSSTNKKEVIGYDTGPANTLLDTFYSQHFYNPNKQTTNTHYDPAGKNAAQGKLLEALVAAALADDYFQQPAPKSTGREKFNPVWLTELLAKTGLEKAAKEDILRSLVEITALSLSNEVNKLDPTTTAEIYICGGGWQNDFLISRLEKLLAPRKMASTASLGLDPQLVEASAFAWLAKQNLEGLAGNLPSVTGAKGKRVLGGYYPA